MRIACIGCGILPVSFTTHGLNFCSGCYEEAGFCRCTDCAQSESPCNCDCEDPSNEYTACVGCREAADDSDEQEFFYKTSSGAV